MMGKRIIKLTLGLTATVILISCAVVPPTLIPSTTTVSSTTISLAESPIFATVEPSATTSPTVTTPEPEQATDQPTIVKKQPAAPPHFNAGENVVIDTIHMVNVTDGWGISGPYILTTRDGGKSWQEASPPESLPDGNLARAYGAFPDEQTAWVIYGVDQSGATDPTYAYFQIQPIASVWSTFNGGKTWTASPPLMHKAIGDWTWAEFAFVDDTTGWMMMRGVYLGAGTHYMAQFFQTFDGVTWHPLESDVGVDYTGMVFADEDTGWLTWQTTGPYAAAPPAYALTSDGGYYWDVNELPPPDDAPHLFEQFEYCESYQPDLLSPQSIRLLAACFDYYYPPKEFISYLYASDDSGDSWNMYPLPEKVNGAQSTLIFFDEDNCLLLGRDMYQSDDGGETWTYIKTVSWDGQFSFVDDQNGWAIARNDKELALVKTTNGGKTWVQLDPIVTR
jgi:photosystem II stability/assembly factor-like uncharacterized protein